MRKGARVIVQTPARPEPRAGTYIRRDMKRFMPFLIRFDDGEELWLAAVFIEVQ